MYWRLNNKYSQSPAESFLVLLLPVLVVVNGNSLYIGLWAAITVVDECPSDIGRSLL